MTDYTETTIDGWTCRHYYPGEEWGYRSASNRSVEFCADSDGLRIDETSGGYMGYSGSYGITANVFMWLAQAVR